MGNCRVAAFLAKKNARQGWARLMSPKFAFASGWLFIAQVPRFMVLCACLPMKQWTLWIAHAQRHHGIMGYCIYCGWRAEIALELLKSKEGIRFLIRKHSPSSKIWEWIGATTLRFSKAYVFLTGFNFPGCRSSKVWSEKTNLTIKMLPGLVWGVVTHHKSFEQLAQGHQSPCGRRSRQAPFAKTR